MKKICIALAALSPMLLQAAPLSPGVLSGTREPAVATSFGNWHRGPARVTVDELFACPENTVLDWPCVESEVGYSGFQSSDQGRYGMPTIFYQAFHGCYKSVNEIRVIGLFNYFDEDSYNWLGCLERGAIDGDYKMTEPVKFEIAFYRQDETAVQEGSMAAQKALRVDKIANPGANANGTHEKVSALSLGAGESATVKATMNPSNLVEGMYESVIEIRSNDELKPLHIIPVYFANGIMTSIEPVTVAISETKLTAEGLSITADNAIADILVVDVAGRMVIRMSPGENSAVVPVESLGDRVYVLSVTYVDGSSESMKFALSR